MAALVLTGISTALTVAGTIASGNAARKEANYEATQLRQQAGQERATAQRVALNKQRETDYVLSRSRALAAASGAGADDPTVADLQSDIAGEGQYNVLSALFTGEERARGLEQGAATKVYEGQSAFQASRLKAVGQAVAGMSSMAMGGTPSRSSTIGDSGTSMYGKYINPFVPSSNSGWGSGDDWSKYLR